MRAERRVEQQIDIEESRFIFILVRPVGLVWTADWLISIHFLNNCLTLCAGADLMRLTIQSRDRLWSKREVT
jgi:hypothetical protein